MPSEREDNKPDQRIVVRLSQEDLRGSEHE